MMKTTGKILIVDDDNDILVASKLLLKRKFTDVSTCNQPEHIPTFFEKQHFDVVLLDMNFGPGESSGAQGFYWLKRIREIAPQSIIIMITAHGGVDVAVEAMKLGATDFIAKPWHNEKVIATVTTAVMLAQSQTQAKTLQAKNDVLVQVNNLNHQQNIIGNSVPMQAVHTLISRSAPTDANVLILGENGTGKELVAREVHQKSLRANRLFMSVDLGALSESLFESELFGHKKGAFTGANHERIGRLLAADGGTLFLDEIGNLPLHLQAKLLTVLEQRKVIPLGSNEAIAFDVRIIAATNVSKHALQDENKFRQDLLFRLNTVELTLPPLRKRSEDIIPLAEHYLQHYGKKYHKPTKTLSSDAIHALNTYQWPGNIRELRHVIERTTILSATETLMAQDFQLSTAAPQQVSNHIEYSNEQPSSAFTETANNNVQENSSPTTLSQELNLEKLEKQAVSLALKKHKYNISHSAKELGLTRAALYRRMEKHGL
ncbi:sigma-54-dependent transcriptional regulator [Cognaticolwellia mytili]|uniref:sigma-54-dependent transcriptional regulator n=1 Tax=Cognaticolwellia mytili TaxID=1888913 RepID=UPI001F38613F|nr:sigma-54 dependent transcriptional regulator [Cognaticolwellia mytili]